MIDGLDVRQIQQDSLLAHIAIVPQETILFSGSVRDNIRYGSPDATDDEVIAAAQSRAGARLHSRAAERL